MLLWTSLAALMAACAVAAEPPTPGSREASGTEMRVDGDAAVWVLGRDQSIDRSSTTFTALVSRLGCNSGVTGQVLPPEIHMTESEVVVTFSVSRRSSLVLQGVQATGQSPTQSISGNPCWTGRSSMATACLTGKRQLHPSATLTPRVSAHDGHGGRCLFASPRSTLMPHSARLPGRGHTAGSERPNRRTIRPARSMSGHADGLWRRDVEFLLVSIAGCQRVRIRRRC